MKTSGLWREDVLSCISVSAHISIAFGCRFLDVIAGSTWIYCSEDGKTVWFIF